MVEYRYRKEPVRNNVSYVRIERYFWTAPKRAAIQQTDAVPYSTKILLISPMQQKGIHKYDAKDVQHKRHLQAGQALYGGSYAQAGTGKKDGGCR